MKVTKQTSAHEQENHRRFLRRLRRHFGPQQVQLIDFAYDLAKYGHRGQNREGGGRYFEHSREVTLIVLDELGIWNAPITITLLNHDNWEDSFLLNFWRTKMLFGHQVARWLQALTKPKLRKGESKAARDHRYFMSLVRCEPRVALIKCADRLHNLRTLGGCSPQKQERKRKETLRYFPAIIQNVAEESSATAAFFTREFAKLVPGWPA